MQELLARLARALAEAGIPYMVIGGQAVLLYGEPRLTLDIDLTLALSPEELTRVLAVAREAELTPLVDAAEFVPRTLVLPCQHTGTGARVDFIFSLTDYEREAIDRARSVEVGGVPVSYAAVEDLLIHKVFAGRPRDLEDARTVMARHPEFDADYVLRWLEVLQDAADRPLLSRFNQLWDETR